MRERRSDMARGRWAGGLSRRGFTLLELLVAISIVAVLISLLMPAVSGVRRRAEQFDCQMNLRSVAFDFRMFADPGLHGDRGDDSQLPRRQFRLETFQESQYRIDEFWAWPGTTFEGTTADLGVMACPSVQGPVVLRSQTPCSQGAVTPPRHVSYGFNLRLYRPEELLQGRWITRPTPLTDRILSAPGQVPLVWEIDGAEAERRGVTPHYSAPPLEADRPYGDGHAWFPGARHGGCMQVAFVGGEVACTGSPLEEDSWRWEYQP